VVECRETHGELPHEQPSQVARKWGQKGEGKIIRGQFMRRIANLRFKISKPKIPAQKILLNRHLKPGRTSPPVKISTGRVKALTLSGV
jgi:hypothetical protein